MSYAVKILADSVSPGNPHRLTTFEVTFPRFILAELNTHRMFSRNSASSRAIPIPKQIKKIRKDPFVPLGFGQAQKGMQSGENLTGVKSWLARQTWLKSRYAAIAAAWLLDKLNVHKQFANRLLEPWGWQTAIVSSTEWQNFFALRANSQAQPEFRKIAEMMMDARIMSLPQQLAPSEWHLPLVDRDEIREHFALASVDDDVRDIWAYWVKVSVGRCARVSYLTHDGKRDPNADIELHDRLKKSGHLSPFEHVARPFTGGEWETVHALENYAIGQEAPQLANSLRYEGNFAGWHQARKDIRGEWDFTLQ